MTEESKDDLMVHEMHYDKNGLNLKLGGQTAMVFLSTLVDLFKTNGGKNFLTMTVHKDDIKYAITIQNCNGEDSPAEKLERYEKALKKIANPDATEYLSWQDDMTEQGNDLNEWDWFSSIAKVALETKK